MSNKKKTDKGNRGTEQIEQKKEKLLRSIRTKAGNISEACKAANIGRTTFYRWMEEDEKFKSLVWEVWESLLDIAESKLFEKIQSGNMRAITFFLKTKGKSRGYVERQELQTVEDSVFKEVLHEAGISLSDYRGMKAREIIIKKLKEKDQIIEIG